MRKINTESVQAFLNSENFKSSNTEIVSHSGGTFFFLHGNEIARKTPEGEISISNAGWFSNTTKSRLNSIPGVDILQKAGKWFLNGKEWGGEWVTV